MKKCAKYFKRLEDTSSTNEKILMLEHFLRYKKFRQVVSYALSKDMKFKVKQFPEYVEKPKEKQSGLLGANKRVNPLDLLTEFSKLPGVKKHQKELLFDSLDTPEKYDIVKRICTKDLKCGVNAKTVNKARKGTVNIVPYMRCSTKAHIHNIQYPAFIQVKEDGMFVNVMVNTKGQIRILTRNGKIVYKLNALKKAITCGFKRANQAHKKNKAQECRGIAQNELAKNISYNMVYTGELLVYQDGELAPRETGNGILNSCIHGTVSAKDAECVVLRIWDCLPLADFKDGLCEETYHSRIFRCRQFIRYVNDSHFIALVETKIVKSYRQAKRFYNSCVKRKKEGSVLKDFRLIWKYHTSTLAIKMVDKIDVELRAISWKYGRSGTKFEKCIGSIEFVSECGKITVHAGSGLTEKQRGIKKVKSTSKFAIKSGPLWIDSREVDKQNRYWDEIVKNRTVCRLECKSLIQDKRDKEKYSLYQPRNIVERFDRDTADTLEEVLNR